MKIRSICPLPLGPHDVVSRETANSMIGQKFPSKVEGKEVGKSVIVDVDWRDQNDVWITIETELEGEWTEKLRGMI